MIYKYNGILTTCTYSTCGDFVCIYEELFKVIDEMNSFAGFKYYGSVSPHSQPHAQLTL